VSKAGKYAFSYFIFSPSFREMKSSLTRPWTCFCCALLAFLFGAMPTLPSQENAVIAPGATLQKLADGFRFTEGPTADAQGRVFFTDQPNNRIHLWSLEGKLSTWMEPAGRSNGMFFDSAGFLWSCADEKNELWRISPQGKVTVMVSHYQGKALEGPNDVWVRFDGSVYFTDPYYQRPWSSRKKGEQNAQAVYFLSADHQHLTRVADDLAKPNGLVGTPDGKHLYLSDLGANKTYRYNIQPDGTLTHKTLFCEMGSDGMTMDEHGNVYLTNKGVFVYNVLGKQIAHIAVPEPWVGNVCFGGKEGQTLFITASKGFYSLRMKVHGADRPRPQLP
jgi:gluconolactonase